MKKTLAIAFAVSFGTVVFAAEKGWFDAKIDTYATWPTNDAAAFGGTWSNETAATLAGGKLNFAATSDAPLCFVASAAKNVGKDAKAVSVAFSLDFRPFTSDSLPVIPAEAKAGVVVVKEGEAQTYYVILDDGTANAWTNSAIAVDAADKDVVVTLATNDAQTVRATYAFGSRTVSGLVRTADARVNGTRIFGDGTLAALSATYETYTVPVVPGTNQVEVAAATEAEALAQVEIVAPAEAQGVITDKAAYEAMFTKTATKVAGKDNTYVVTVVFNPENQTVKNIQKQVNDETAALDPAKVASGEKAATTVENTVRGVYYVMEADGSLKTMTPVDEKLGDGSAVQLATPKYDGAGFYRIKVSPTRTMPGK